MLKKLLSLTLAAIMLLGVLTSMASCDFLSSPEEESKGAVNDKETVLSVESEADSETDETNTESTETEKKKEYRVLLTSDMHYTTLGTYYETDRDVRLQYWVDGILKEHEIKPFDLIIIVGDTSLDYWGWNGGGSYQRKPSVSDTKIFIEKYVSQLPEDVPTIVLPGNHELYTNAKWKEITGNNRNESFVLGDNLFIMPDSFSGAVDPVYVGKGKNDSPYKAVDMEFIQGEIDKNPDCKNIFLVSHHFDLSQESEEFKTLLKTEKRIVGLFSGHTHDKAIKELGDEYNGLCIAQTGNFGSDGDQTVTNFYWGYRDILIQEEKASSMYIIPDCAFYVDVQKYEVTRKLSNMRIYDLVR